MEHGGDLKWKNGTQIADWYHRDGLKYIVGPDFEPTDTLFADPVTHTRLGPLSGSNWRTELDIGRIIENDYEAPKVPDSWKSKNDTPL